MLMKALLILCVLINITIIDNIGCICLVNQEIITFDFETYEQSRKPFPSPKAQNRLKYIYN